MYLKIDQFLQVYASISTYMNIYFWESWSWWKFYSVKSPTDYLIREWEIMSSYFFISQYSVLSYVYLYLKFERKRKKMEKMYESISWRSDGSGIRSQNQILLFLSYVKNISLYLERNFITLSRDRFIYNFTFDKIQVSILYIFYYVIHTLLHYVLEYSVTSLKYTVTQFMNLLIVFCICNEPQIL